MIQNAGCLELHELVPRAVSTFGVLAPYSWTSAESRKTSKILKKVVLSWCSTLLSTCRSKRMSLNMRVRWQKALQLLEPPGRCCDCSTPAGCGTATETTKAENQHGLVSVTPAQKQKECTWKSPSQNALAKTVKGKESEDDEAEPSQGRFFRAIIKAIRG